MDDGVGLDIVDSSGNGNDGRASSVRWSSGVHNSAVQINRGGVIDCGNSESLNITKAISIDAWVKPWSPRYQEQPTILRKEGAYALHLGPSKAASFTVWVDGKPQSLSAKIGDWPNGQWRHLLGSYDGTSIRIYLNGSLAAEKNIAGGKISKSNSAIHIGSSRRRMRFSGTIDEVRVMAETISAEQVLDTFRAGMFDISRKRNVFTSFYEKYSKRKPVELEPGTLWIDVEDFDEYGGWWMDTQFVPRMGSPYLIAAGLGQPVENASTKVSIPVASMYRLWVRNKNWLANGHAPGKFQVAVNDRISETVFGTEPVRAWVWQDGGKFALQKGENRIELIDGTGYYGRCDAIILTRDLEFVPQQEQEDYLPMRERFVKETPVKEMGTF